MGCPVPILTVQLSKVSTMIHTAELPRTGPEFHGKSELIPYILKGFLVWLLDLNWHYLLLSKRSAAFKRDYFIPLLQENSEVLYHCYVKRKFCFVCMCGGCGEGRVEG